MYNQERKIRYIEYKESNTITPLGGLKRLFTMITAYEEKNQKDCCDFSESEIISFYKMLGTRSVGTIINHNSRLSLYTDWCLTQGLVKDGQNHYRMLKKTDFDACINSLAIQVIAFDREEWLNQLHGLINPRDQFIMLYLFEVGTKNMTDYLKDITIDWFEGNVLHLPDRDVTVSNLLISFAERANQEDMIYGYGINNRAFKAEENGKIVKWKITSRYPAHNFIMLFARIFAAMGCPTLKAKEVERMGQLDMLRKLAIENNLDIKQVTLDPELFDKVAKQYSINISPALYLSRNIGYLN